MIRFSCHARHARLAPLLLAAASITPHGAAQDASPAPILQWFDGSYQTMNTRAADVFMAGYGTLWTPPPGRADSGDQSVGYDVYDRFDLGTWDRKTLYGTETGLKTVAGALHRQGARLNIDAVINHNGFSDAGTPGFIESGGYPGFLLQDPDGGTDPFGAPGTDGDFNSIFDYGTLRERLAGLIDIDHAKNFRFVRSPVPGFENPVAGDHGGNLPAGTVPRFGRLANVADENNRRFYPDRDGPYIEVFDPVTGEQGIRIYQFDTNNPLSGDPVGENATGYLMRNLQWLVQEVGVDGFRIDAAKHVEGFTFDFLDRAVYRSNPRTLLDGSTDHVFSYSEVFDGNRDTLLSYKKNTIDPNDIGKVGGNRDSLDFAFHFAQKSNLTGNGFQNDWRSLVSADMDAYDDGLINGSAGVKFVASHDEGGPGLSNVAHAQMLMLPGNNVVYFNGKEFGDGRDFPKDGRGDALGGVYGDTVTVLVNIRNTHGRGDYRERWLEKENYAFERSNSALVLLSNRTDAGFDERRVDVDFGFGTTLVELTGNAANRGDIAELITVDNDVPFGQNRATVRFARNDNGSDEGYLIYGLATPESAAGIELSQASGTPVGLVAGGTPAANGFENGTTRLTDWHVVSDDQFTLKLQTQAVTLTGQRLENGQLVQASVRDRAADGDNALFRIDGGLDLNANAGVDFVTPGTVAYGFERFTTTSLNGFDDANGVGLYEQTIDTTALSEGVHFLTARAFRHRDDGGPAVFNDFKKVVYVDRFDPVSSIHELKSVNVAGDGDFDMVFASDDFTADSIHTFLNLGAAVSDADILGMVGGGSQAEQVDINLFKKFYGGVGAGNNVLTVVTFEPTGTRNIQRFAGTTIDADQGRGLGLGDLDFDGAYTPGDLSGDGSFEQVLYRRNAVFNPAGDTNADGLVDNRDLFGLKPVLNTGAADQATLDEYRTVLRRRGNVNQQFEADAYDIDFLFDQVGTTPSDPYQAWLYDLDVDGAITQGDVDTLVRTIFETEYGDANLDGDVDVFQFDGGGDAQILTSNLGTTSGATWSRGDFNGDGDVDVFEFSGGGDAQLLTSNLGFAAATAAALRAALASDMAADTEQVPGGTASGTYDPATGEIAIAIGAGIGVIGIESLDGERLVPANLTDALAAAQATAATIAFFSAGGLETGTFNLGSIVAPGTDVSDLGFAYTPLGGSLVTADLVVVPEPGSAALMLAVGLLATRRRRAAA